jgi:hypothetical protein
VAQLPISGRCGCGAVRFELSEPPWIAGYCHCTRCQHRTGAAASANAGINASTLSFLSGEELVAVWRPSGGGNDKLFCRICSAQLFARNPSSPAQMAVRLGALEGDPIVRPSYRQFVHYAAAWEPIPDDGLPRFPESRNQAAKAD